MEKPNHESPGQLVRSLLAERGLTQTVLAAVTGLEQSAVSRIVQDKRAIDAHTALILADALSVTAESLLDAQQAFDLERARRASSPDPARALRARLFAELPLTEMMKRGWLATKSVRDVEQVEANLASFFGVSSLDQIEVLAHSAKKTNVGAEVTPAQLAWLHRVRAIAEELIVHRYSPKAVREAVERLAGLRGSAEDVRSVPGILAEAGVRFVLAETLPSAKIDGVCFWLNDLAPVIGMTLRHDRVDNFWFVLRHELEHVIRGHGRRSPVIDIDIQGGDTSRVAEEELVANAAAADFCVPSGQMDRFIQKKAPFFMERDVLGFAATLGVHPGLVVGQLQHKTGRYDRFRSHLVGVRQSIAPSAAVDGWGEPYPLDNS